MTEKKIPHSGFKAKVFTINALILLLSMLCVTQYPESGGHISTMVAAFSIFSGAVVGARAWQQNAY